MGLREKEPSHVHTADFVRSAPGAARPAARGGTVPPGTCQQRAPGALDAVGAADAERGRYPPFHWRRPAVVGGAQELPLRDRRIRMPGRRHRPARLHRGQSQRQHRLLAGGVRARARAAGQGVGEDDRAGFPWLRPAAPGDPLFHREPAQPARRRAPGLPARRSDPGQRDHRRACPRPCDLHAVAQRMATLRTPEWPRANARA